MSLTVDDDRSPLSCDVAAGTDGEPALMAQGTESYESYRTISAAAVVSCGLAVLSLVSLLNFWTLKAIPVLGIVIGVIALRRIAKAPHELSGRNAALSGVVVSAVLLVAGSALAWYDYATELPDGYVRINYELLKPADDRPDAPPAAAAALNGQRVFIKGYMFPTAHAKVTKFVLCRDNGDCCFGGQPPKSDMIFIELQEPLQTEFSTKIRRVAGTLRIAGARSAEIENDILYRLEADYIR